MKLGRYRKFIVAVLGVGAMIGMRYYGVTIPGLDAVVLDLIVGALTSWGVYQAANDPMPKSDDFTGGEV